MAGFRHNSQIIRNSRKTEKFYDHFIKRQNGDSNVGDIVMLVTDLRCWWQNNYVGVFFRYVGDFRNVSNRSQAS